MPPTRKQKHSMSTLRTANRWPDHALQRTAPAVTLAAPRRPATQPSRQPPPSLSLGSLSLHLAPRSVAHSGMRQASSRLVLSWRRRAGSVIFLPSGPVRQKESMAAPFSLLMRAWVMARPSWPMVSKTWKRRAEQLFFCKFFGSVRAGSGDGEKFLEFQREWVVLGRER